jgi:hypothetical protein
MQAPSRSRELLVALFLLGVILLAPPVLLIFNKATLIVGIPSLYLYLFAVWTALIVLVALTVEKRQAADDAEAEAELPRKETGQVAGGPTDA